MKYIIVIVLSMFCLSFYAQDQLVTYPSTPYITSTVIEDPSTIPKMGICGNISDFKIGHNNDFTVRVKKSSETTWTELFEYNTFVNSGIGDISRTTRSSFVSFDYSGTVNVEIKCNNFTLIEGKVLIRPQSRKITQSISGNVLTLTLTAPTATNYSNGKSYSDKLSIELNGDRYRNLQLFANLLHNYPSTTSLLPVQPASPSTTTQNLIVYDKIQNGGPLNNYNKALYDNVPKKIIIKDGAIVIIPYVLFPGSTNSSIVMQNGDEIYIEGGGILKGGIAADNKNNIKVYGRGIIDLTDLPKQYNSDNPNEYAYYQCMRIRECKKVILDGLILNDSQQLCVELKDCGGSTTDEIDNININNLKLFSRVVWGDGFHMKGTSNVSINDCFVRTSDDCISIYASRIDGFPGYLNRDALNIKVTNSVLYADNAHDIVIGWHGNRILNSGNNIYNLNFDNIDILEHDQNWTDQNGNIHAEYDGAIGIVCSDENKCDNFLFNNVRVEDFTNGSLLSVRVMPEGYGDAVKSGQYVKNIRFQNLTYNGSGEHKSVIQGVNCDRYVDGVHFENLKINGILITKLSDYVLPLGQINSYPIVMPPLFDTFGFDTNKYAYNITFQEANNYSNYLGDGYYTIKNIGSTTSFLKNIISPNYVTSNGNTIDERIWQIINVPGTGHYRLHPYIDESKTLQNSSIRTIPDSACNGRYITNEVDNSILTNQEWKIVPTTISGVTTYKINNAFTRSYLTYSSASISSNTIVLPKNDTSNFQKWKITPVLVDKLSSKSPLINNPKKEALNEIIIFPNPTNDFLNINNLMDSIDCYIEIIDLKGSKILSKQLNSENSKVYVGDINQGLYMVKIEKNGVVIFSSKFIKN